MRIRNVRRGGAAVLLVGAGLALAACGSNDDSTNAASSSSVSASSTTSAASTTSTPSGPATATPGATDGSTAGAGSSPGVGNSGGATASSTSGPRSAAGGTVPACATSRLRTTTAGTNSGAGSTMFQLVFQNTGSTPCTLHGYPGVSFVKIHNIQLGKAAARTGGATPVVTLIPNAHAYADVRTVNGIGGYDASQCDLTTVPTLRIYPPNQTESTNIPWNTKECVGPDVQNLEVGPVHGNK